MLNDNLISIRYKILQYIYELNKRGKSVGQSVMQRVLGLDQLPDSYLAQIIVELVDDGFVKGISYTRNKTWTAVGFNRPVITVHGVEYLEENRFMQKEKSLFWDEVMGAVELALHAELNNLIN